MREAKIKRKSNETEIFLHLQLDGSGQGEIDTGIGFFDHMLMQIVKHALVDLQLKVKGDLHIDQHHTVEDVGICLGMGLEQALGTKRSITRYAHAYAPLDEALARSVIDVSGRPGLFWRVRFSRTEPGGMVDELFYEFFNSLVSNAKITVHVDLLHGSNSHHQIEAIFKSFALALKDAISLDDRKSGQVPSSKGIL